MKDARLSIMRCHVNDFRLLMMEVILCIVVVSVVRDAE